VTREKYASSRSPHSQGKSGSCSGHRTRVGCVMRSAGAGVRSARLVATVPDPARYQPIDAISAPGSAYRSTSWSRSGSASSNAGPDQWLRSDGCTRGSHSGCRPAAVRRARAGGRPGARTRAGHRGQRPLTGAGQRRGEDERSDALRHAPSDRLGNSAPDVVAREDDAVERELIHESHHAACLSGGGVTVSRLDRVLVGFSESTQVRHDHFHRVGQHWHQRAEVRARPGPAVEEQDR
jgi:hypothetical protein